MSLKSEVSQVFVFMLVAFVVVIILFFGIASVRKITGSIDESEMKIFTEALKEDISRMHAYKGTQIYKYDVPSSIAYIIVFDRDYARSLMDEEFIRANPLIRDSIQSNEEKNLFFFSKKGKLVASHYVGDVAIDRLGEEECDGFGTIQVIGRSASLRLTNRGSGKIVIGDECSNLSYWTYEYPFPSLGQDMTSQRAAVSSAKNIRLRQNQITGKLFENASFNTSTTGISSEERLVRIYFRADVPSGSEMLFKIGFKNASGWAFYGPLIGATEGGRVRIVNALTGESKEQYIVPSPIEDRYYTYSGQMIREPGYNYSDIMVQALMKPDSSGSLSPTLSYVRISHKKR